MLPLPTVGPVEILIIVAVGALLAFGGSLVLRFKRGWKAQRGRKTQKKSASGRRRQP